MVEAKISKKGQVVIPQNIREELNLSPGATLKVEIRNGNIVLKTCRKPPEDIFVEAGPQLTEPALRKAKREGDKAAQLLKDRDIE